MKIPQKHIAKGNTKYNYMLFDSVWNFNAFVDMEMQGLSVKNKERWMSVNASTKNNLHNQTAWYGTPTPKDIDELNEHRTFLGMQLLKTIQPKIKDQLVQYMDHLDNVVMPKPKVSYNDRGLGVFSFDRAAMALYKQHRVNTQTPVNTTISQLNVELGNFGNRTAVKNVYAYFENKETSYPSLQLYLMSGANADVQGNQMLYVGLACSELVEFLELRGVPVEVNVLLGTSHSGQASIGVIRIKRFQDKLDKNQLLLMTSDPRYFRYRGFKALIALSNHFGLTIPKGLGSLTKGLGYDFVNTINAKGFVFEQSYSLESAVKEVSNIIETYNQNLKDGKAA